MTRSTSAFIRALLTTLGSVATAVAHAQAGPAPASPAQASAPASDQSQAAAVQEVVITGSRIAAPNLTSTSPIQVVNSTEIRQTGATDAIDLLNTLPQNFQSATADFSNTTNPLTAAGGLTTADLRGLGPQRTLVLVDGRRLGSADPNTLNPNPAPDLDQIPVALVDRIEVVTGGASAVYGSDAIAGVVNFIMKRNFEGLQVDGQWGVDQHGNHNTYAQQLAEAQGFPTPTSSLHDGQTKDFSILAGTNIADGQGNITAWLEYRHANPVFARDRDFSACQVAADFPNDCIGTTNSNHFDVGGVVYSVVGNQLLPFPRPGSSPPPEFNSNQYLNLSREDQRYNAGFQAHLDLNPAVKPYVDFSFMNDKSTSQVAPSGLFYPAGNVTTASVPGVGGENLVNCSNPLLSPQEQSILCTPGQISGDAANPGSAGNSAVVDIGRRNIEGGPRIAYFDHTNYRAVAGLGGDLATGWTYDAYGQY
ncbi:MAG TPA: TonB-dependent receptor plug domain-containing protein, partial [Steroidobacteraceae bacterium]|nr:TonB-dependent receptor plug domain-containing protein [Steroidobacteraceae bacterium]